MYIHVNIRGNSQSLMYQSNWGFFPAHIMQRKISHDDMMTKGHVKLLACTVNLPPDLKTTLGDLSTLTIVLQSWKWESETDRNVCGHRIKSVEGTSIPGREIDSNINIHTYILLPNSASLTVTCSESVPLSVLFLAVVCLYLRNLCTSVTPAVTQCITLGPI